MTEIFFLVICTLEYKTLSQGGCELKVVSGELITGVPMIGQGLQKVGLLTETYLEEDNSQILNIMLFISRSGDIYRTQLKRS